MNYVSTNLGFKEKYFFDWKEVFRSYSTTLRYCPKFFALFFRRWKSQLFLKYKSQNLSSNKKCGTDLLNKMLEARTLCHIWELFYFCTFLDEPVKKATFAKSAKLVKNANLFKNAIQKTPDQIDYDEKNEGIW